MMSTPRALAAADELETWRLAVLDAGTNSCRFDQGGAAVIIAKHYAALESTVEAMARALEPLSMLPLPESYHEHPTRRGRRGSVADRDYTRGAIEERERLVRIANAFGAGQALAAIGFTRCKSRHAETDQRCLKGEGHGGPEGYIQHQSESVTWLEDAAKARAALASWRALTGEGKP